MGKQANNSRYVNEPKHRHHFKYAGALLLLVLCVAVAVMVPLLLDHLYDVGKVTPLIIVPWDAKDALAYCGAILAAIIAICGVFFTLKNGEKERETQIRDSVAPYFSAIFLDQENKRNPFFDFLVKGGPGQEKAETRSSEPSEYREIESYTVYAIIGDSISYRRQLSDEQREKVQSTLVEEEIAQGVRAAVANPVVYVPLKMRNIGPGNASAVRVGVDRKEDPWSGVCNWTIESGKDFYLGVYADTSKQGALGDYEIRIAFYDCLGYQYMQSFGLVVSTEGGTPQVNMDYVGSRKVISNDERKSYLESVDDLTSRNKLFS